MTKIRYCLRFIGVIIGLLQSNHWLIKSGYFSDQRIKARP